jgi:hypothetical protein
MSNAPPTSSMTPAAVIKGGIFAKYGTTGNLRILATPY